ncbi:Protein CBG05701 [Caenorhabditis briggsae]|uniref:Protein CBG05701 n=1 Tax=Caenorhabditis briggsae TaxID=6238 RepID=A8X1U6_CAEBR|nr:Protein CBG05701 [Caenorhabditis briggsae]CAP26606.1 Protein CBG05701 [Caenorhabditis briggsae]
MKLVLLVSFIAAFVGSSIALDCTQIPASAVVTGHFVNIPAGAETPVQIPPNYDCTYQVSVPPMVYARVRLENGMKGNNDMIIGRDGQLTTTVVSSRSNSVMQFYVFPNTTTTFRVTTRSVDMHSTFRLVVFYQKKLNSSVTYLGNPDMKYFTLNDLQVNSYKTPQTMVAKERISLSVAHSGWDADKFDNFFVIDGDFEHVKEVYRMSRFVYQNYISTGNNLTVVGLDNSVSESSVVFTPLSQILQYDSVTSIGTYFQANQLDINAKIGAKKKQAVNVIAMNDYTRILSVDKTSDPDCSLKAVQSPPTATSEVFLDFSTVTDFPRNITHQSFTIVAENCAATIKMVSLNY